MERPTDNSQVGVSATDSVVAGDPPFSSAKRMELLQQLLHYTRFSDAILLVSGAQGSGKSYVYRHFIQTLDGEPCRCCLLKGDPMQSVHQLVMAIAADLNIRVAPEHSTADAVADIAQVMAAEAAGGLRYVVAVDDAQEFGPESIDMLIQLRAQQPANSMSLVFFAEGLVEDLNQAVAGIPFFHLKIPPFSFEDIAGYLRMRLEKVGFEGEFPFSLYQLEDIYQRSDGWPSAINYLANEHLQSLAKEQSLDDEMEEQSPGSLRLVFGALLVVVLAVGILAWANNWFAPTQQTVAIELPSPTDQVERFSLRSDESSDAEGEVRVASSRTSDELDGAEEDRRDTADKVEDSVPERQVIAEPREAGAESGQALIVNDPSINEASVLVVEPKGKTPVAQPSDTAAKPVVAAKVVTSGQDKASRRRTADLKETTPTATSSVTTKILSESTGQSIDPSVETSTRQSAEQFVPQPLTANERFLMGLEPSRFTMQVLGSRSEQTVRDFINKQASSAKFIYYERSHRGAPWFVVIYGHFATKPLAQIAASKLPYAIRKQKPWIRPLSDVQKEIQGHRQLKID